MGKRLDPEAWFHTLATHFVETQIYFHLNQAGVFHRLRRGAVLPIELADELQLDGRILEILLDYAASIGDLVARDDGGRYGLTEFGEAVLARYGKTNGQRQTYNLFDVRVGAWGPVWTNLGALLDQSLVYGRDLHRAGDYATDGLFKLAAPLAPAIEQVAARLGASTVVEVGPTSGILAQLSEWNPARCYIGLDRKEQSLAEASALAAERGIQQIRWVHSDLFEPEAWLSEIPNGGPTLFFSCHFHEFLAAGEDRLRQTLQRLTGWEGAAGIVALEQPRLDASMRGEVPVTEWLYAHSNVLIHHLIRNAKILTDGEWRQLLLDGGCASVTAENTAGFGFKAFVGVTGA